MKMGKRIIVCYINVCISAWGLAQDKAWTPESLLPAFSSSNYIIGTDDFKSSCKNQNLSILNAYYNRGGKVEVSATLDVVNCEMAGWEFVYRHCPALEVHAGLMRLPYMKECLYSPRVLDGIGRSQAADYMNSYTHDLCGISSHGRDVGILVEGSLIPIENRYLFHYAMGVYNGNGYNFRDNNKYKDFAFRFSCQSGRFWTCSIGGIFGNYHDIQSDSNPFRYRLSSALWYDDHRFFVRSENIFGVTDSMKSDGLYLSTGYWLTSYLLASGKYDYFRKDFDSADSGITDLSCCLNLKFCNNIQFRMQYDKFLYSDSAISNKDRLSVCLIIRLQTR